MTIAFHKITTMYHCTLLAQKYIFFHKTQFIPCCTYTYHIEQKKNIKIQLITANINLFRKTLKSYQRGTDRDIEAAAQEYYVPFTSIQEYNITTRLYVKPKRSTFITNKNRFVHINNKINLDPCASTTKTEVITA